jgi:hypothetical protein
MPTHVDNLLKIQDLGRLSTNFVGMTHQAPTLPWK